MTKLRLIVCSIFLFSLPAFFVTTVESQTDTNRYPVPAVHEHIGYNADGELSAWDSEGNLIPRRSEEKRFTLDQLRRMPYGTEDGLVFDFGIADLNGTIFYGFMEKNSEIRYSYPIYFHSTGKIAFGRAVIDIANKMKGRYDIIDWQKTGVSHIGYRIVNEDGDFLYDGRIVLKGTGPFTVDTSVIEGPFINLLTSNSAVISFETNFQIVAGVSADGKTFWDKKASTHHEIALTGLEPDKSYAYTVIIGDITESYDFQTAPLPGSRKPFTFGYASDGRGNNGGGERYLWGTNAYILKRLGVACVANNVRFFQFTGDLIDGYTNNIGEIELEYANWKRTAEPFAHYFPFIAAMGNHEVLLHYFQKDSLRVRVDRFPYDTESSEMIFANNFVNPTNGPLSEDGAAYDPDPDKTDFPPYKENVFSYEYDNVAIISLNSNYWFSPSIRKTAPYGGNFHGYIMDNQLKWLEKKLAEYEADKNIDHIFITCHTPLFPNGGHVHDDMWYSGSNDPRPYIAGKAVGKGIIERRDELIDLMMNKSSKVVATLTGDEHNYSLLRVTDSMPRYPENYDKEKLESFRPFWHINNGAAGAPYYGKQETPWQDHVRKFSTQNALVLFHVSGKTIRVEVINPDTLEKLDEFELISG